MATTRAEANLMFDYALGHVRAAGVDGNGRSLASDAAIVRATWARFQGFGNIVHADALAAVKRAIRAREGASVLNRNPTDANAWLNRDYAEKPVLDRRRGRYEYRVVGIVGDGPGRVEAAITVRSTRRLSGDEVFARAGQAWTDDIAPQAGYATRLRNQGTDARPTFIVVSATRDSGD